MSGRTDYTLIKLKSLISQLLGRFRDMVISQFLGRIRERFRVRVRVTRLHNAQTGYMIQCKAQILRHMTNYQLENKQLGYIDN